MNRHGIPLLASLPLLLAFAGAGAVAVAVGPAPDRNRPLSEFAFDTWDVRNGLPQNSVMALAQDPTGYLWLGTFGGLSRYDGTRFTRDVRSGLPVLERGATTLLTEADGVMWVGTQSAGVIRLDPNGTARSYGTESGLPSNIVWSIYRDPLNRLWVGTAAGLCQIEDTVTACLGPNDGLPVMPVSAVRMTADGSLWIGTEGAGLFRLNENGLVSLRQIDGQEVLRIQDLAVGVQGHLWIATFGNGLLEHDGQRFITWGADRGLASVNIRCLLVDPLGALWVGTYGNGLQRLADGQFDLLDSGSGLPNGHIQSLLVDAEGSLWFGTNGGLNRLRRAKFSTVSMREGLSGPFVRSVVEDAAGDLWVGVDSNGLNRIREGRVVEVLRSPTLQSDSVRALWPDGDGGIWIGSYAGGLSHRSADGQLRHFPQLPKPAIEHIRALFEDSRSRLWIGSDIDGALVMAGEQITHYRRNQELITGDVRAIAEAPDGAIWLGTYGRGLYRIDDDGIAVRQSFLEDAIIFSMHFGEDRLLIGTESGLTLHTPSERITRRLDIPALDGAVFSILDDRMSRIWLCTNKAIIAIDRSSLDGPGDIEASAYDSAHGLRSDQCNGASQPAAWRDRRGRLWFPTADGVSWVDPASLPINPRPPPVVIQQVRVDGHPIAPDQRRSIEIPPGARRLEIDYAALSFISPSKQTYRYQLAGLDEQWSNAGPRRTAYYNDVPPGRYTFHLVAANSDGVWNAAGASLHLSVLPLLHQTLWFRAGVALLVLALIAGFIRWRGADLRRQKRALERKVAERTRALADANADLETTVHELERAQQQLIEAEKLAALGGLVAGVAHEINTPVGNALTLVSHLSERARRDGAGEPDEALGLIQRNLERAGKIVSRFKRIAVSKEREARRRFRLAAVLSDARLGLGQDIEREGHRLVIDCADAIELDGYPEALFELITHLIQNSLAHGFKQPGGTIRIAASRSDDRVRIEYSDDGVGVDPAIRQRLFEPFSTHRRGTHSGLGMHIVYNIATRLMDGEIHCLDGPGARFLIDLPDAPRH